MYCEYCKGNMVTSIARVVGTNVDIVYLVCIDCGSKYDTKTEKWTYSDRARKIVESSMRVSKLGEIE